MPLGPIQTLTTCFMQLNCVTGGAAVPNFGTGDAAVAAVPNF